MQENLKFKREFVRFKKRQQDLQKIFQTKRIVFDQRQNLQIQEKLSLEDCIKIIKYDLSTSKLSLDALDCLYQQDVNVTKQLNQFLIEYIIKCDFTTTQVTRKVLILLNKIVLYDDSAYLQIGNVANEFFSKLAQIMKFDSQANNVLVIVKLIENLFIDSAQFPGQYLVDSLQEKENLFTILISILECNVENKVNIGCIGFFYQFIEYYQNTECKNLDLISKLFYNLIDLTIVQLDLQLHNQFAYTGFKLFRLCFDKDYPIALNDKFIILLTFIFKTIIDKQIEINLVKYYYSRILVHICRNIITNAQSIKSFLQIGLVDIVLSLLNEELPNLQKQGLKILQALLEMDLEDNTIQDILFNGIAKQLCVLLEFGVENIKLIIIQILSLQNPQQTLKFYRDYQLLNSITSCLTNDVTSIDVKRELLDLLCEQAIQQEGIEQQIDQIKKTLNQIRSEQLQEQIIQILTFLD